MKHIIIGNGVAGITAAREIRMLDDTAEIVVISDESNFFYSRTALMYIFSGDLEAKDTEPYERYFYKKNRIQLVKDRITSINYSKKELKGTNNPSYSYDKLLIATGSTPRLMDWAGKDLKGVCTFYSFQDLEYLQKLAITTQEAVIVGGGLIGIEMVEILLKKGIKVHYLVRGPIYFPPALSLEESDMVVAHMRSHGVNVILDDELESIQGPEGKISGITTKKELTLPCQITGIAIGVTPNIRFLKSTDLDIKRGILVNQNLSTNQPDVWAAGDCTELTDRHFTDTSSVRSWM